MSSFIGHALPAFSLYFSPQKQSPIYQLKYRWLWLVWLIIVAWMPDIDHVVPWLNAAAHEGMRITHSIVACLILPIATVLFLRFLQVIGQELRWLTVQLFLASFSHLILDVLTGAMWLPLLYPFSTQLFKLPFGLLPSAGKISLTNYYLYRNLVIELGVLLPASFSLHLLIHPESKFPGRTIAIGVLLLCSLCFMLWAASLFR